MKIGRDRRSWIVALWGRRTWPFRFGSIEIRSRIPKSQSRKDGWERGGLEP